MNAVATPTRKAASKAAAKTQPAKCPAQGPAATENDPRGAFTPKAVKSAFYNVEDLLHQAYHTDEAHDWSGDSDRLLRVARDIAGKAANHPPAGNDIEGIGFDIAGLIRAARLVPGDSESPERKALLDQAATHLNWLTECDQCGQDCCDPGVPRPAAPQSSAHIAPAPEPSPTNETFGSPLMLTIEAREVIYACVENYEAPETVWALHTVLDVCVASLDEQKITAKGCQEASNLLAQAIALGSLLLEEINGHRWEILLDAALSLMLLAKETLDNGAQETTHA